MKLLAILLAGFVIMGGTVQAHDVGHCTAEELLDASERLGRWLEHVSAPKKADLGDAYWAYEVYGRSADMLWEGGADMSALPVLCEEAAQFYVLAGWYTRGLLFAYIMDMDEHLPAELQMSRLERERMGDWLLQEANSLFARLGETVKAGQAALGLER